MTLGKEFISVFFAPIFKLLHRFENFPIKKLKCSLLPYEGRENPASKIWKLNYI